MIAISWVKALSQARPGQASACCCCLLPAACCLLPAGVSCIFQKVPCMQCTVLSQQKQHTLTHHHVLSVLSTPLTWPFMEDNHCEITSYFTTCCEECFTIFPVKLHHLEQAPTIIKSCEGSLP